LVGQSLNEQQPSDSTAACAQLPALSDLEVGLARFDLIKKRRSLTHFFCDRFGLQEVLQVVFPAGFRIRSRHVESAKRVCPHHRSRAFPVQIEIPDVE